MKKTFLSLFSILGAVTILCSCGSMQPDDNLKKVVSGDIFGGRPMDPVQQKEMENAARDQEREMPHNYSVDKETENGNGRLALKMPL